MQLDVDPEELVGQSGLVTNIDWTRSVVETTALLDALCARAEGRPEPTVVVLRLDGTATGDRSWPGAVGIQEVNRWERAVRRLERMDAVSVIVASRTCGGPTLDLLLAADYRIVTADLRVLLPVNDDQFWPGMAVHRLANQIGLARARQVVLWGTEISARQVLDLGLADEITADVPEAVRTTTVFIGRTAGTELRLRRQLLLEAPATSYEEALGPHLAACDRELRRSCRRNGDGR